MELANQMLNITKPSVMIFTEHQGNRYFLINNNQDAIDVLGIVAKKRLKDDYWYDNDSSKQKNRSLSNLSEKEKIEIILNSRGLSKNYDKQLYGFMMHRCSEGSEYEGWNIETFE